MPLTLETKARMRQLGTVVLQKNASVPLLALAFDVRSALNGSSDPPRREWLEEAAEYLELRLLDWRDMHHADGDVIDQSAKVIIETMLSLARRYLADPTAVFSQW